MGIVRIAAGGIIFAVGIYFLKAWANGPLCTSDARLDGKVALITGANTGIGKYTALDFVNRGAKVYLACRSLERGNAAAADIKKEAGVGDDRVLVRQLDLGSLESVREFAKKFKAEEPRLDLLINNAGTMMNPLTSTKDGFEMQVGVNHLGSGVTTYSLHPGSIVTELQRHVAVYPGLDTLAYVLTYPIFKDVKHGAQTTICAAVDPALEEVTGKYYSDVAECDPKCRVCNDIDQDAKDLWKRSIELVKVTAAETDPSLL